MIKPSGLFLTSGSLRQAPYSVSDILKGVLDGKQASASFLKKRSKKLLLYEAVLLKPPRNR
jgi:hypothetical protein